VYGNQLSALSPIDDQVICTSSSSSNTTEEEGEHYCNCASDCLGVGDQQHEQKGSSIGRRCQCEEAQGCCNKYFVDNNITNCVLCEAGLSNPELPVPAWGYTAICNDAIDYVYTRLDEYGTEEQCNRAKFDGFKEGCRCPGYSPPGEATTKPTSLENDDNIFV